MLIAISCDGLDGWLMERMIDVFGYRYHIEKRLKSEDVEVVGTDEG
jgi:hypothetical protein